MRARNAMWDFLSRLFRIESQAVSTTVERSDKVESKPISVSLREASHADISFIHTILVNGAGSGHFHPMFAEDKTHQDYLRDNLKSILDYGLWQKSLRPPTTVEANMLVYEADGRAIGFLIYSEWEPGSSKLEQPEYEMYMAGIIPPERGKGHGSMMISGFLQSVPKEWVLKARCYPASERMFEMLKRRGFAHEGTTPSGTRVLVLART